jgi:hypothetical protein
MAEQTISPGVFTEERDQTFLAQGVQEIGGAFVGPTDKGPAFEPVEIESPQDYDNRFGNDGLYMDYATRNYLRDASTATVVRILGEEGYESEAVEIELPEGELSKREFQISKTTLEFDPDAIEPGEEIGFEVCVRGRQQRSTSEDLQPFNLEIEEYVDGEFHDLVYSGSELDEDCVVDSFNVSTEEFADVQYKVIVELEDGQTDDMMSPTGRVQGFYLQNVDYNWGDGESRGPGEVFSLQGTVGNLDPQTEYNYQVHRNIPNGGTEIVAEETGVGTDVFNAFWVHDGSDGDVLSYAVRVEQGDSVDVDGPSPAVNVNERDGSTTGFEILDVNFNVGPGESVDEGDEIQVTAELSGPAQVSTVTENNVTGSNDSANFTFDLTQSSNSTIYFTIEVGGSTVDIDDGDFLEYEVEFQELDGNGNPISGNTALTVSPEVVVTGGILKLANVNWNFDQGDELDLDAGTSVQFEVEGLTSPDYDYEITEIINPDGPATETSVVDVTNTSDTQIDIDIPQSGNAVDGDDIAFRLDINPSDGQDSDTSPTRIVDDLDDPSPAEIAFKQVNWSFEANDVVENGDDVLADFFIFGDGEQDLDYEIEVVTLDEQGNETETGSFAASATALDTTAGEFFYEDWDVTDSGAPIFDGDEFFYRIKLLDGTDTVVAESDSPNLFFSGAVEQVFTFDSYDFQFNGGSDVEKGERLAAFFDVRRPNDEEYSYEIHEYVNGSMNGKVVADTDSEENQLTIIDADFDRVEVGWFAGKRLAADSDDPNALSVGDTVVYGIEITNEEPGGSTVERLSGELTVTERVPSGDLTLASLAPTEALRSDANMITDAQINPANADVRGFELILQSGNLMSSDSTSGFGVAEHEPNDEVEAVFENQDLEPAGPIGPTLISGKSYEVSLDEGDDNYILDLFGTDPEGVREVYAKKSFPEVFEELLDEEDADPQKTVDLKANYRGLGLDFEDQAYSGAQTPWIVSQDVQPNQPGTERRDLIRFETLGDGDASNREVKVSIRNVRYASEVSGSEYGTFDVIVRDYEDSDANPDILESYTGVNLDPDSGNYVARVIGNKETIFREDGKLVDRGGESGVFEVASDYIRVRVNPEVVKANEAGKDGLSHLVPWGFGPYDVPYELDGELPHGVKKRLEQAAVVEDETYQVLPDGSIDFDSANVDGPFEDQVHFGFDFGWEGNESFLQATSEVASGDAEDNQDLGFVLSDAFVEDPNLQGVRQIEYGDGAEENVPPSTRKFSVGFQGGFDGSDPATPQNLGEDITSSNTQGFDVSGPDASGTEAYQKAIGILGNEDQFDINLLVTPGIINDQHGAVVRSGINMVEERADAFYVFDPTGVESTIQDAISSVQTIDSSYAATYYPWMRIRDQQRNKQVRVPPSVLIPRVYAFNDQTAAEWFAPAGFERGGVPEAISAVLRLRRDDRDELYANRVNPIAQFPDQGVSVWGQKTLQTQASALDRVNVRRLLIRVKKFIASTSRFLVFEQNVPETRNRFLNIVNPFLNQVQQQNGLFAFRVKMDAENNPPEVIDRNQLVGEIFLQPTRTAEFIRLTFNVLPTGAEFEDL